VEIIGENGALISNLMVISGHILCGKLGGHQRKYVHTGTNGDVQPCQPEAAVGLLVYPAEGDKGRVYEIELLKFKDLPSNFAN